MLRFLFIGIFLLILIPLIFVQSVFSESHQVTSKIWLISSNENGCSTANYHATTFMQSISFVYLGMYGLTGDFREPQCVFLWEAEKAPEKLSEAMSEVDLPILIIDSEIESEIFYTPNKYDHWQLLGFDSPHIVTPYFSIPSISQTASWKLSHQLSHFIIHHYRASELFYLNWIHVVDSEFKQCIEQRKRIGLCHGRYTPVYGIPIPSIDKSQTEMIMLRIHPNLYTGEKKSYEEFYLSREILSESNSQVIVFPKWVMQVENWYDDGLISDSEFENAIKHYSSKGIIDSQNLASESASGSQLSTLKLNRINKIIGGQPIVFSGSLSSSYGIIPNAEILIKSDGECPVGGIIAKGKTDKYGKFRIYSVSEVWGGNDNLIHIYAEFSGNEIFALSESTSQQVVISPGNAQHCGFRQGL